MAWDDELELRINDELAIARRHHSQFESYEVTVPVRRGRNKVSVKLNNRKSLSWGGWCFAFSAHLADGTLMRPNAASPVVP